MVQFLRSHFKHRPRGSSWYGAFGSTSVRDNSGLDGVDGKYLVVLAHESDGFVVVEVLFVKPRLGADAGVRKVLVRVRGEEPQEGHLHHTRSLVSDLEAAPKDRKPGALPRRPPPGDVDDLGGVDVREHARLPGHAHVAEDVHGVVRHPKVRVDPVPAVFELGVAVEEVLAGPGGVVLGADGLLHALEVLPHRVDVGVHVHQLGVKVIHSLALALLLACIPPNPF